MKTLYFVVFCCCLLLCGCPADSSRPLWNSQDAVDEPALLGTWVPADSHLQGEMVFEQSSEHEYRLAIPVEGGVVQNYEIHLVRLKGQLFLDCIFDRETLNGKEITYPMAVRPLHLIVKITISGDDMTYALLEETKLRDFSPEAGLDYQVSEEGTTITAQTEDVRSFIINHAGDLFEDPEHMKRKK